MKLLALLLLGIAAAPAMAQTDEIELYPGCAWNELILPFNGKANQQLSFRYQACEGSTVEFVLNDEGLLSQKWETTSNPVAQFWSLKGVKPSAFIARTAAEFIAPGEEGRCIVHLDMATGHYAFTPNAEYLDELIARDEPFGACGQYGDSNDSIQYWMVVNNALIAYVWVGQDTPIFDPESFKYVNTEKPSVVE